MKNRLFIAAVPALAALLSVPAVAEVSAKSDAGFVIVHTAEVSVAPDVVWKRLIAPKLWWNPSHSWSGSVEGFYLDTQAGGCFCERFQEKDAEGQIRNVGSVEHMRVIFSDPGKVLRMQGALGPLQSEAVLGTLTVKIDPVKSGGGSKVTLSYVVGGYMRYKTDEIAPAVDSMLAEQFARLNKPFAVPSTLKTTVPVKGKASKSVPEKAVDPEKGGLKLDLEDIESKAAGEAAASDPVPEKR
jgi:hypothetical protein